MSSSYLLWSSNLNHIIYQLLLFQGGDCEPPRAHTFIHTYTHYIYTHLLCTKYRSHYSVHANSPKRNGLAINNFFTLTLYDLGPCMTVSQSGTNQSGWDLYTNGHLERTSCRYPFGLSWPTNKLLVKRLNKSMSINWTISEYLCPSIGPLVNIYVHLLV